MDSAGAHGGDGKVHAMEGAPRLVIKVSNKGRPKNTTVPNADYARVVRWQKAHRREYREYMKFYMRDWRCRRAVLRMADEAK
jgi:hypothetical protein